MTIDIRKTYATREEQFELLQGLAVAQFFTMILIGASHIRLAHKIKKIGVKPVNIHINNKGST